ncbi:MAG: 1-acyl-sn-glycerol-3-phosphate acyltransferase [Proteobacteria bacterium]|nr:1-acyl-sn-glycerol-3-phosphate acyltransferase [Pseudomonadota bacterium]
MSALKTAPRKFYRSILFGLWLIIGVLLTIIFLRSTIPPYGIASTIVKKWLGITSRIFGVKIKFYGNALPVKTLFVSNHISWLDILILGSLIPIHFLSKHEVKDMPLFGWLATRAGTLYIKRGKKNSASDASSEITDALKQQHNALIFAEGTTTDGHIKKFHSRLMQSAIDASATVQPIAIFYPLLNTKSNKLEVNPAALFTGNTTIGESYDLITRTATIDVEVHFLKPIDSTGKTRDEIALHAYDEVVDAIKEIKTR